jgi:RHS repeat-associated protein
MNDPFPFGMLMPNRSENSDQYRFGYQGSEKDDETKGQGNSYDFGARIYDPRVGRWLSLDPAQQEYPALSPYHAFANNPIIFTDPDGKRNTIYLVVLPSAEAELDNVDFEKVIEEANNRLEDLGLKTRVVLFNPEAKGEFDPNKLENTDSFALLGSVEEINSTINDENGIAKKGFEEVSRQAIGWNGGKLNTEESALGTYNTPHLAKNRLGKGIMVDSESMKANSEEVLQISLVEALALTIIHGSTHNSRGGGHSGGINGDGDYAKSHIQSSGLDFLYEILNNLDNIDAMKTNFGDEKQKDNYPDKQ